MFVYNNCLLNDAFGDMDIDTLVEKSRPQFLHNLDYAYYRINENVVHDLNQMMENFFSVTDGQIKAYFDLYRLNVLVKHNPESPIINAMNHYLKGYESNNRFSIFLNRKVALALNKEVECRRILAQGEANRIGPYVIKELAGIYRRNIMMRKGRNICRNIEEPGLGEHIYIYSFQLDQIHEVNETLASMHIRCDTLVKP